MFSLKIKRYTIPIFKYLKGCHTERGLLRTRLQTKCGNYKEAVDLVDILGGLSLVSGFQAKAESHQGFCSSYWH